MYAVSWIVRFRGTLTQGPNAGKSYAYENSWAGVQFDTREQAEALVAKYRALEPGLSFKVLSRLYVGGRKGRFVETEERGETCTTQSKR